MTVPFSELIEKYLTDSLTEGEAALFHAMLEEAANQAVLAAMLDEMLYSGDLHATQQDVLRELSFHRISGSIAARNRPAVIKKIRGWKWAAAIFVVALSVSIYYLTHNSGQSPTIQMNIPAGHQGAVLTLADGSHVSLDTLQNAVVALQGGATAKVVNGMLTYEGSTDQLLYNTMSTPKGRKYPVTLPDGTVVWLNSSSSIRYPMTFQGPYREVTVTGEAYFEVTKNARMPFRVDVNGKAVIDVLGTHFNVSAYINEGSINTTLLEGRVKVSRDQTGVILKPGQQAQILAPTAAITVLDTVNIDNVMAWKNGYFVFEGRRFDEIMRQLERWYDIEVVFEGKVPDKRLWGEMTMDVPLSGVLKYLDGLGIRYQQAGRKLIIKD